MKTLIVGMIALPLLAFELQAELASTVWNPAANDSTSGKWSESANWTPEGVPVAASKAVFNVDPAVPCLVNSAATPAQLVVGDAGPGSIIITNGGNLTTGAAGDDTNGWTAIGYDDVGRLEVQSGATAVFKYHLWVGLTTTPHGAGNGTLVISGGKVSVGGMFGLGWSGGKGTAQINGGTLTLKDWHDTDSIKGRSVMDIAGGTVVLPGNRLASVDAYVATNKITAYGGAGTVVRKYDSETGKTVITAIRGENSGDKKPSK